MRIVRSSNVATGESYKGVTIRVMIRTPKLMMILGELPPGGEVPAHSHENEQVGFWLKGRAEFKSGSQSHEVEPGTSYHFEPNEPHYVRMLGDEPGMYIDVFSPPRDEFLRKEASSGEGGH